VESEPPGGAVANLQGHRGLTSAQGVRMAA
jgi:hypothetical protein